MLPVLMQLIPGLSSHATSADAVELSLRVNRIKKTNVKINHKRASSGTHYFQLGGKTLFVL